MRYWLIRRRLRHHVGCSPLRRPSVLPLCRQLSHDRFPGLRARRLRRHNRGIGGQREVQRQKAPQSLDSCLRRDREAQRHV